MRIFIKLYKNSSRGKRHHCSSGAAGVSVYGFPGQADRYWSAQYAAHARGYTRTLYAAWFSPGSIFRVRERGSDISIAVYRGEAVDGIVNIDAFGNR